MVSLRPHTPVESVEKKATLLYSRTIAIFEIALD
jgi:hypothetical protein